MPSLMENDLAEKIEANLARIRSITNAASDAGRALNPGEETTIRGILEENKPLETQRDILLDAAKREAAQAQTRAFYSGHTADVQVRQADDSARFLKDIAATPGVTGPAAEFIRGRAKAHKDNDTATLERYQRAVQHDLSTRAIAHELLAEVPGLLPKPVVGPLINWIDISTPVTGAFTRLPLVAKGSTFDRPRVTQHTQAGKQATEKTDFASRTLKVTSLNIPKQTIGAALNLSRQVIDWSEPGVLEIVLQDMANQIALECEKAVTDAVIAAATQTTTLDLSTATAKDVVAAIFAASAQVYAGTKARLANRILMAPDVLGAVAGIAADDGRGILNFGYGLGVNNIGEATGGAATYEGIQILGLPVAVAPNAAAGTFLVADAQSVEVYEDRTQLLTVDEPRIAGLEVGMWTYLGVGVVEPLGLVSLAP
jgi:hypothetical protein